MNKTNYRGRRIARWTILMKDDEETALNMRDYWICRCDCGNVVSVYLQNVIRGSSKQCKKCADESRKKKREDQDNELLKDEIRVGKRFGRLDVLKINSPTDWIARCDCGEIVRIKDNRQNEFRLSCGCEFTKEIRVKSAELIGLRFGSLKVERFLGFRIDSDGSIMPFYELQCGCGKIIEKPQKSIFSNKTCGCLYRPRPEEKRSECQPLTEIPEVKERQDNPQEELFLDNNQIESIKQLFKTGYYEKENIIDMFNINEKRLMSIIEKE